MNRSPSPGASTRIGSRIAAIALLLAGIATAVIAPMAISGYPITHSTHFNLSWVFQYQAQVNGGQWYPRWLEYSNYGFGNPTFAFYPPLCMMATLPFHLMGLDMASSLVASMWLAVVVFTAGTFRYARHFFSASTAAIAAISAGTMPYLFVDIYQRGAIAEVWGIAAIPWLLWTSHLAIAGNHLVPSNSAPNNSVEPSARRFRWDVLVGVAIAYGFLILSHLPTLLMVTCLWVLLPLFGSRHRGNTVRLFCAAFLGGGGWTAAYILPVLTERRLIQVDALTALEEYRPSNRLMLNNLLSLQPQLTQHWFDRSLLPLWVVSVALVTATALVWLWIQHQRPYRSFSVQIMAGYWLLISAIALLMTTDVLGWMYPIVPPLQTIQFSWRWMTVLCTTGPLLLAYLLDMAQRHQHAARRLVSALIVTVVLAIAAVNITLSVRTIQHASFDHTTISQFTQLAEAKVFPSEPIQQPQDSFMYWHWRHPDGLGLVDVPEYRHRAVSLAMPPTRPYPLLEWLDRGDDKTEFAISGELTLLSWEYGLRHFRATNLGEEPRAVQLRTFFYPGWVASLGERSIPIEPSQDGRLQLSIPSGSHEVTVRYRGTIAHRLGLWIGGFMMTILASRWVMGAPRRSQKTIGELE
ncbi:MAG: hypothetical protein AAF974_00135 [Cyanobacteria bacterium P01_E01_bin.34]